jgi:hypothetical protein
MPKVGWILGTFLAMYLVATIVGFASYSLINPRAMWISVFTLMPVVSAVIIFFYLRRMQFSRRDCTRETFRLVLVWIGLSFAFGAATYILIIPFASHTTPNWTFFQDQSPWIWFSYAVLLLSADAGRRIYLRNLND